MTAHVLTGLPASGKTTLARSLDAMRFNLDDTRSMLGFPAGSPQWTRDKETVAVSTMVAGMKAAILAGRDIVADNCHMTPSTPRLYRKHLGSLGVEFIVHDLTDVPVDECIARDALRPEPVGEAVIRRLAASGEKAREGGWRLTAEWLRYPEPEPYVAPVGGMRAHLVDVDGTVALNMSGRSPYDWSRVGCDTPNLPVIHAIQAVGAESEIIFISGRDEVCRADTEAWLMYHFGLSYSPQLHMRPAGDMRPDWVVKAELFDAHVRGHYDVRAVWDDRDQVVRMWRAMGVTCFQVAEGAF